MFSKNIKTRLLLWYSMTLLIILVGFSFAILKNFEYQNIKTVDTQLLSVAYDIEHDLDEYLDGGNKDFDEGEEFYIKNLYISIFQKKNENIKSILKSSSKLEIYDFSEEFKTIFEELENSVRILTYQSKKNSNIYIQISTTL